jgi:hypothetical protein
MKTKKLGRSTIYLLSILMLALVGCNPVASTATVEAPTAGAPTAGAPSPSAEPTTAVVQFTLTVDQAPVTVTHGGTASDLVKGQTQDIFLNDKIDVGVGGRSELVYSDRVTVEIMQGAELVMGDVTTEAGGRIEATFLQNKGHVHVTIGDNAQAGVILKTNDSQITSQADGSVYSVCYKPGAGGLTCVHVEKGSIEVRDNTTGKSQIYPPSVAGYTFNGQAPQPPVCTHPQEYTDWLSKMRQGVTVETLGTMVARWITEPCPGDATPTNPVATPSPTVQPTPAVVQFQLAVDQAPVTVTHGGTASELAKGQIQDIFLNDKVDVGAGGRGDLVIPNRVEVEIMQGGEVVVGDVTTEAGGRIEATVLQNKGHIHVIIAEKAKTDVILITQDSQVTSLADGSVYSECYKPGADGLTCVLVEKGSLEVQDKTTGKSQIYPASVAGYTFNGKAPQPPVCIHQQEYNDWYSKMRQGVPVETLGAMVSRWITEPCPAKPTPTPTTTPTTRPLAILWDLSKGPRTGSDGEYSPEGLYSGLKTLLAADGITIVSNRSDLSKVQLNNYRVLVISVLSANSSSYSAAEATLIQKFVSQGGSLLIMGDIAGSPNTLDQVASIFKVKMQQSPDQTTVTTFNSSPIFNGVKKIEFWSGGSSIGADSFDVLPAALGNSATAIAVIEKYPGRVVIVGDANFCDNRGLPLVDNKTFTINLFRWLSFIN